MVDDGNGKRSRKHLRLAFSPDHLGNLWNETADPVFPRVILPLSEKRRSKLRPAIRGQPDLEWWRALFVKARDIPFLKGENDRGWRADLEFVVKRRMEILEGKYDSVKSEGRKPEWLKLISQDG
jgi:hypothetical protein